MENPYLNIKYSIVVEKDRFKDSYTYPNSTAHVRVTMTTEECYIIGMADRCLNKTQAYDQKSKTLEKAWSTRMVS